MKPAEKPLKQRTIQQNRAMHKYFQLVADRLNDAGLDMRIVLKPEVEIPWAPASVKEYLWRPIQRLMLQKESTTMLTTRDIDRVYETLNRFLAEKHGVSEPWPSFDDLLERMDL